MANLDQSQQQEPRRQRQQQQHILIIPYPAQGHMLPLLDLAHLLSSLPTLTLTITIAVTPRNLPTLSPLLSSCPSIQPLVFDFPNYPSLPPNVENAKDLIPTAYNFALLIHALGSLRSPLLQWARSLPSSNLLTAIISDFFVGWANGLARELEIPCLTFCPYGPFSLSLVHCLWRNMPKREEGSLVLFPSVPKSPEIPWFQLSSIYRGYVEGDSVWEFVRESFLANFGSWGFVFDSFDELERAYLDHVRRELGHQHVWSVGPLCQVSTYAGGERGGPSAVQAGDLLTWLDGFAEGSVVYVSFGSQTVLSVAQGAALADGLERSRAPFVWCVKMGNTGEEVVPAGFEERVQGRGVVVRGWAPQVVLLSHGSVGFFLMHCGWNSVLEGISAGVMLLAWPMMADQYMNARLVVEEVGVGVKVCEGLDTVPDSDELARLIKEAVNGDRKEKVRAKELRREAFDAVKEGGSSFKNLNGLVEALSKASGLEQ